MKIFLLFTLVFVSAWAQETVYFDLREDCSLHRVDSNGELRPSMWMPFCVVSDDFMMNVAGENQFQGYIYRSDYGTPDRFEAYDSASGSFDLLTDMAPGLNYKNAKLDHDGSYLYFHKDFPTSGKIQKSVLFQVDTNSGEHRKIVDIEDADGLRIQEFDITKAGNLVIMYSELVNPISMKYIDKLCVVNIETGDIQIVSLPGVYNLSGLTVASDADLFVVSGRESINDIYSVYLIDAQTQAYSTIIDDEYGNNSDLLTLSPSGRYLAYQAGSPWIEVLKIYDFETGRTRKIQRLFGNRWFRALTFNFDESNLYYSNADRLMSYNISKRKRRVIYKSDNGDVIDGIWVQKR